MVNYKITKAAWEVLSDEMKGHYLPMAGGEMYGLVTGGENPEVVSLREQLGTQGVALQTAQTALATAEAQIKTATQTAEDKYKADLEASAAKVAKLQQDNADNARSEIVNAIASRFSTPDLFSATVGQRVKAEYNEAGELVVTCVNSKGETVTKEALTDEFVKNADYKQYLKPQSTTTVTTPAAPTNMPNMQQNILPHTGGTQPTSAVVYSNDGRPTVNFGQASSADIKAAIASQLANQQ